MKISLLMLAILIFINFSLTAQSIVEFECYGDAYTIELSNIKADTSEYGFHGYFRTISFDSLRGFISINCQGDTNPRYFGGDDYIVISESDHLRAGRLKSDSTIYWKERILKEDLVINYIGDLSNIDTFERIFNSVEQKNKNNR